MNAAAQVPSIKAARSAPPAPFIGGAHMSGCSSVRLEYRPWKAGVVGSNPATRTTFQPSAPEGVSPGCGQAPSAAEGWVRGAADQPVTTWPTARPLAR